MSRICECCGNCSKHCLCDEDCEPYNDFYDSDEDCRSCESVQCCKGLRGMEVVSAPIEG